jgi:branched-chain amino acid transport system substrate-binding protein
MGLTRRAFAAGLAELVAASGLVLRARAAEASVKIGMVVSISGPAAAEGERARNGANLALKEINSAGGVLGKPLQILFEDDQGTNPGAVLAFSKLASQPDIVGFIGTNRSTQMLAMAPDILNAARPVAFCATDPKLTKLGNPWLFRCQATDAEGSREIARFGSVGLGKKKWAIVHSTDTYGAGGATMLTAALGQFGAKSVLDEGYTDQNQDFTPIVLAIKQSGADVLGSYMTFDNDVGLFARQLRQLGVTMPWVGSPSIMNAAAIKLAGRALNDTYAVGGYAEAATAATKAFGAAYREAYHIPPDTIASGPFDAVTVLARGINKAGTTSPGAVRKAILAIKGFKGAQGDYDFTANGDGVHSYNLVKNENGNVAFMKLIEGKA